MTIKEPTFVDSLHEITKSVLCDVGHDDSEANAITERIIDGVRDYWGGDNVYIHRGRRNNPDDIIADFNGTNRDAVCQKHGISVRTFYRMLKGG